MSQVRVLKIDRLTAGYFKNGRVSPVITDLSLQIGQGEALGVVGGSGCGKSTLAHAIVGGLEDRGGQIVQGSIQFPLEKTPEVYSPGRVAFIPQDPNAALDPLFTIGHGFIELIRLYHPEMPPSQKDVYIQSLLSDVELDFTLKDLKRYPHELSGGEKQRILIAYAMMGHPYLVVADEPTSSLDVTIQAEIMKLFRKIRQEWSVSFLFITHNLMLVKNFCERTAVLQAGRIVEEEKTNTLFVSPRHEYTRLLLQAIPKI